MGRIDEPVSGKYDPKSIFAEVGKLQPKERLLRWKQVQPRVGICRSYAHYLAKAGKFPAPIKLLGGKATAWVESEVDAWVQKQITDREQATDKQHEVT